MKLRLLIAAIGLSGVVAAAATPRGVSLSGGDGSSFDRAIVVRAPSDPAAVHAEYDYIRAHYRGWRSIRQSLVDRHRRLYDVITFTTPDRKQRVLYFDVTNYFGKGVGR